MGTEPFDLARARVLVCNDDGILAPGLDLLAGAVRSLAAEVWVVAPSVEQSAASHSLTMRRPLRVHEVGPRRFTVDGTPTDCVLLAVHEIMSDSPPDVVLSGVNRGGNLGEDAFYSGTIAAAREGALLGFRAAALSLAYTDGSAVKWPTAERWAGAAVARLAETTWPTGVFMNVNMPDVDADAVTGIEATRAGRRKLGGAIHKAADPRGEPCYWIGHYRHEDRDDPGTDVEAVARGAVAITPIGIELTDEPALAALAAAFA